jgi:hypothetical protein
MEEKPKKRNNDLNIKSKSQLFFGQEFSQKIQELKIFIFGLKGVNKYNH